MIADKKIERIKVTWTERLNKMKEENQEGIKKLNEFHSKALNFYYCAHFSLDW